MITLKPLYDTHVKNENMITVTKKILINAKIKQKRVKKYERLLKDIIHIMNGTLT